MLRNIAQFSIFFLYLVPSYNLESFSSFCIVFLCIQLKLLFLFVFTSFALSKSVWLLSGLISSVHSLSSSTEPPVLLSASLNLQKCFPPEAYFCHAEFTILLYRHFPLIITPIYDALCVSDDQKGETNSKIQLYSFQVTSLTRVFHICLSFPF